MFESLIGLAAIIALFVIISRQQSRIRLVERELGALRSLVLSGTVAPAAKAAEAVVADGTPAEAAAVAVADVAAPPIPDTAAEVPAAPADVAGADVVSGPWAKGEAPPQAAEPATAGPAEAAQPAAKAARQTDVETALGTRWAVWVGGIALALGGLFLIR